MNSCRDTRNAETLGEVILHNATFDDVIQHCKVYLLLPSSWEKNDLGEFPMRASKATRSDKPESWPILFADALGFESNETVASSIFSRYSQMRTGTKSSPNFVQGRDDDYDGALVLRRLVFNLLVFLCEVDPGALNGPLSRLPSTLEYLELSNFQFKSMELYLKGYPALKFAHWSGSSKDWTWFYIDVCLQMRTRGLHALIDTSPDSERSRMGLDKWDYVFFLVLYAALRAADEKCRLSFFLEGNCKERAPSGYVLWCALTNVFERPKLQTARVAFQKTKLDLLTLGKSDAVNEESDKASALYLATSIIPYLGGMGSMTNVEVTELTKNHIENSEVRQNFGSSEDTLSDIRVSAANAGTSVDKDRFPDSYSLVAKKGKKNGSATNRQVSTERGKHVMFETAVDPDKVNASAKPSSGRGNSKQNESGKGKKNPSDTGNTARIHVGTEVWKKCTPEDKAQLLLGNKTGNVKTLEQEHKPNSEGGKPKDKPNPGSSNQDKKPKKKVGRGRSNGTSASDGKKTKKRKGGDNGKGEKKRVRRVAFTDEVGKDDSVETIDLTDE